MQKIDPVSWERFSKQIEMGKQTVQELSKLYIIIHEKVRAAIKNSIVNQQYDFAKEAQQHIEFIKTILLRIRQAKNDEYLIQVQQKMLEKYQKTLLLLLEQIELNLKVQQNKIGLNFQSLKRLKPNPHQQYDLHDEIMKSTKRMVRSKSGKRPKNLNKNQHQIIDKKVGSVTQLGNIVFQKKLKIQDNIKNHIKVEKTNVSFENKYKNDNLQKYLTLRKQFADLILRNQNAANPHKSLEHQQKQIQMVNKNKKLEIKNKLFPEFQIKTKFIKPKVKQNIMQILAEVKVKLLEDYCNQNINKIKEANQGGLIKLQTKNKNKFQRVYKSNSVSKFSQIQIKVQSKLKSQKQKKQNFQPKNTYYTQRKRSNQKNSQLSHLGHKTDTQFKTSNFFGKSYKSERWNEKQLKLIESQLQKKLIKNKIIKYQQ